MGGAPFLDASGAVVTYAGNTKMQIAFRFPGSSTVEPTKGVAGVRRRTSTAAS
jgi:hypothetical protein